MESGDNYRRELGNLGEELACEYLQRHGHTLLKRNWRSGHLEIDIITLDKDGRVIGYYERLDIIGTGEAAAIGMSGGGTVEGYIDETWTIEWK